MRAKRSRRFVRCKPRAYLDLPKCGAYADSSSVVITLNGEPMELERPLTVTQLLTRLEIDPRRVAIEHNLSIIRRHTFPDVVVKEGDTVEIVNFVGGG
jgi:sulfur carrier protein